ncbi:MAG: methyltransferase domain-containing protein [Rhodospirillales bacterium]|nr:methyltransferase domain-containing protein [Rhodospirillales bacterium]
MCADYVHGYSDREGRRLGDQATTLAGLLHADVRFPAGSTVLEAGCGVGAQTVVLAANSPGARFTAIDRSEDSLKAARDAVAERGFANVTFRQGDIFDLPFAPASFDHVFVCFVLEHLAEPQKALLRLKDALKPSGTLTVIEGDHGSTFFSPDDEAARQTVRCLIEVQARLGGDALIGRRLYPLMRAAGLGDVAVSPRFVYVDASRPELEEGFTRRTFAAMVEGVRAQALEMGLIDAATWERGIRGLRAATGPEGTFCYTFFKGVGFKGVGRK